MANRAPSKANRSGNRLVRLFRFARSSGLPRAAYRLAKRMAESALFRRWCLFTVVEIHAADLGKLKCGGAIPRVFTVRKAEEEDLPALAAYFDDEAQVQERLNRGDVCVMTLAKGQVCAAVWFAPGPAEYHDDWDELRCVFRVPAGVGWSFDGKGTRMGAWGALMTRFPLIQQEFGLTEVFTVIETDNRESIEGHRSLGYHRRGIIACIGLFSGALRFFREEGARWRLAPGSIDQLAILIRPSTPSRMAGNTNPKHTRGKTL